MFVKYEVLAPSERCPGFDEKAVCQKNTAGCYRPYNFALFTSFLTLILAKEHYFFFILVTMIEH